MHSPDSEANASTDGSTRCFWYGYLIGGLIGAIFGYMMGDMIGWIYMTGTIGCIAALPFDRSGK
jgi:predicted lipid-binding transport protein (Tim44 family)